MGCHLSAFLAMSMAVSDLGAILTVTMCNGLPSPWKNCTPDLNIAHFSGLRLHLSRRMSHSNLERDSHWVQEAWRIGTLARSWLAILSHKTISDCKQMQFLFLVQSFMFVSFPKSTVFYLIKGTFLLWWSHFPNQILGCVFWLMLFMLCFRFEAVWTIPLGYWNTLNFASFLLV